MKIIIKAIKGKQSLTSLITATTGSDLILPEAKFLI